jgi:N-acyl-D-aspartate/D-glutamate deacylase
VQSLSIAILAVFPAFLAAQPYDLVLHGGRVLDPESGLDGIRSVAISGRQIAAISEARLRGKTEIDAAGLVVSPGFIDLHSHGQTPENYRLKAMDGVTTALELEIGVYPAGEWYASREGKSLIHYGASSGHVPARMAVMKDTGVLVPRDTAMNRLATADEQKAILAAVEKGLDEGALGMGLGLTYTPTATASEVLDLFYLMARWKRPVFVHVRSTAITSPGIIESLQEMIADAAISGAPLHIVHINSSALRRTAEALRMIESARARGLDITTEAYPYIAGATALESAQFEPGWQEKKGLTYSDLMWAATGERLTAESFARYRKQGGLVILFSNTEEMVHKAVLHPLSMIASDGIMENGKGHPRAAGTYARILGRYVREEKSLSLMDAIRKCSLMPARRLEAMSPQMRRKGRLKPGADADITVFDPARVIDRATYQQPAQYSEGFRYVLVEGTVVVRDGKLQEDLLPGQGIRAR